MHDSITDDSKGTANQRRCPECDTLTVWRGECNHCGHILEDEPEIATDGSGHVCDACGLSFDTLTELRLHEKDDCPEREIFDEVDPEAEDPGGQIAPQLLTCRDCGTLNAEVPFDETASFADGDYHLIVEFECQTCGGDNENRVVMTGVDEDDLENVPEHLQPDDPELATDGGQGAYPDPENEPLEIRGILHAANFAILETDQGERVELDLRQKHNEDGNYGDAEFEVWGIETTDADESDRNRLRLYCDGRVIPPADKPSGPTVEATLTVDDSEARATLNDIEERVQSITAQFDALQRRIVAEPSPARSDGGISGTAIQAELVARALADLRSRLHADELEEACTYLDDVLENYGLDTLLEGEA